MPMHGTHLLLVGRFGPLVQIEKSGLYVPLRGQRFPSVGQHDVERTLVRVAPRLIVSETGINPLMKIALAPGL